MEKTAKILTITLAMMLCIGLQGVYADQNEPLFDVYTDGTEEFVPESAESGKRLVTHPLAGAEEVTEEALIADGVDVTPLSEDELAAIDALPPVTSGVEGEDTESIYRTDTRVQVYPASSSIASRTGLLTFSAGRCSAWLIGPSAVATAGHCVSNGRGSFYRDFKFYPRHSTGLGSCSWSSAVTNSRWHNSGDENYDYAVVKLRCTVGRTLGSWGYSTANPRNRHAVIPGYPGDKSSTQQWWGHDKVRTTTTNQVFYRADTIGGMSGSPVGGDEVISRGPYSIGIHAYGMHGSGVHRSYNHGTRITSSVFSFLNRHNTR